MKGLAPCLACTDYQINSIQVNVTRNVLEQESLNYYIQKHYKWNTHFPKIQKLYGLYKTLDGKFDKNKIDITVNLISVTLNIIKCQVN